MYSGYHSQVERQFAMTSPEFNHRDRGLSSLQNYSFNKCALVHKIKHQFHDNTQFLSKGLTILLTILFLFFLTDFDIDD